MPVIFQLEINLTDVESNRDIFYIEEYTKDRNAQNVLFLRTRDPFRVLWGDKTYETNKLTVDEDIGEIKKLLVEINLVLIMSVHPGFAGQKFIPNVLDKIKELKKIKDKKNLNFDIEVDGGINFDTSKLVIEAGANILVSGTTIFKNNNGDIKKNIDTLKLS